ncbi:hypothetical protein DINM_004105 [Dirofilaria immitis]|nr:hypothetical protein [Dirofilaria immitis]
MDDLPSLVEEQENLIDNTEEFYLRFQTDEEFKLICANRSADAATFPDNAYRKYYEFVIVFSNIGIMLFYIDEFYIKTTHCINRITDITKFTHTVSGTYAFEAMVQVPPEEITVHTRRIGSDIWYLPCIHAYTLKYDKPILGKIEVSVFQTRFQIGLRIITEEHKIDMTECRTYMLTPHDIQYINFNSTNPNTVFYAQYVTSV